MRFKIHTIQVSNRYEFVNDPDKTDKKSAFQLIADKNGYLVKKTDPILLGKIRKSREVIEKIGKFYTIELNLLVIKS